MSTTSRGPSRRTLVKGAAWSVPVVAVAGASPALASSPPPVRPDVANALGCKWPGGNVNCQNPLAKGFRIYIPFDNTTGYDVQVNILSHSVTSGGTCSRDMQTWDGCGEPSTGVIDIAAGDEVGYWVTWHDDNSGNNKTMTVTYTYTVMTGSGAGTVFGPYTLPVAKVFNTTCPDCPEPTIPTAECGQECEADTTPPTAGTLSATTVAATEVTVQVAGAVDEKALALAPYSFSIDGGTTWSAWQANAVYTFAGLTAETGYTIQHRVQDAAGNVSLGTPITVTTAAAVAASTDVKVDEAPASEGAEPVPAPDTSTEPTP